MRGTEIIVSSNPLGRRFEGIIASGQTFSPGMVVQMDPTVDLVNGKHTCKIYDRDADGDRPAGPLIVVDYDCLGGKTAADAWPVGSSANIRFAGYIPMAGDELNMLLKDISGTGDDHTKGEILMVDDATGKLIATTGSPESEPFLLLESVTDPTADTLAWVVYSGH